MSEPTASTSPAQKRRKVIFSDGAADNGRKAPPAPVSDGPAGMQSLSAEILLKLFAFLDWRQLVTLRPVCKLWKKTTRSTSPSIDLSPYGHLSCLYWLFPRAACIAISSAPDAGAHPRAAPYPTLVERLTPICTFRNLTKLVLTRVVQRSQAIENKYCRNIFQVRTLEELVFESCEHISFDLSMVSGTPRLRQLIVKLGENDGVTGNLSTLKVLKDTLTHLALNNCGNVAGSLSDLKEFFRLEHLDLEGATDIETNDCKPGSFPSLEILDGETYAAVSSDLHRRSIQFTFHRLTSVTINGRIELELFRFAPNLREIDCSDGIVKGDLSDLRFLRDSLCRINLRNNRYLTGSIGDLRDFSLLENLNLENCPKLYPVTPCLRSSDFPSLKKLNAHIPLKCVSDAAPLMELLFNRRAIKNVGVTLCKESPDFQGISYDIGFGVNFVQAGPRKGWKWFCIGTPQIYFFETNWLNNEPQPGDIGYEKYHQDVEGKELGNPSPFAGRYTPPKTREELEEIIREFFEI